MDIVLHVLAVVFWGVLLLSLLVFVHEGGHYLVARAFGVRVTEFYLGLPCKLRLFWKSRRHGTEFGVTPILLGGYNRICGMEYVPEGDMARAFAIVQRQGRVKVDQLADEMGIDEEEAFALLVGLNDLAAIEPYYDPELGEYPAQREYPQAFQTLARDANMLTEYDSGHDFDLEGMTGAGEPRPLSDPEAQLDDERARTYQGCSYPKRLCMLLAGPLVNLVLAFVLVSGLYLGMEYQMPVDTNVIGQVADDSLAASAGLAAGDELTEVAGTPCETWTEVREALQAALAAGVDFEISYVRDGTAAVATIDLPEGEKVDLVGVSCQTEPYHLTLAEAVQGAFDYARLVAGVAARLIMPQHTMEVLSQSSSVVGISVMAEAAVTAGIVDVLALLAAVSMSLGFMNLLPIPPLDGGKILLETIGVVIRRPVPVKVMNALSYVGIAFFIFIFVMALRNDLVNILSV